MGFCFHPLYDIFASCLVSIIVSDYQKDKCIFFFFFFVRTLKLKIQLKDQCRLKPVKYVLGNVCPIMVRLTPKWQLYQFSVNPPSSRGKEGSEAALIMSLQAPRDS